MTHQFKPLLSAKVFVKKPEDTAKNMAILEKHIEASPPEVSIKWDGFRMFEYGGGFIQDRSIYEDTGIFAKMHQEKGTMNEVDYETYTNLFDAMVMTPYFPHPDLLIYLEGSIDDILGRIQERGRAMEQQTPVEYWLEMHERYERWIDSFNACPVLRLNINDYDLMNDPDCSEQIVERIGKFMQQTAVLKR